MNTAYEQSMQSQQNTAMLGLGAVGIAAPRIWPTKSEQKEQEGDEQFDPFAAKNLGKA